MKRRHTPARLCYHVQVALLYGQFPWLHRHTDGSITCETGALATELQTKYSDLCQNLERLVTLGLLADFSYRKSYFICKPTAPVGFLHSAGPVLELTEAPSGAYA
jgi:hypothetical protein